MGFNFGGRRALTASLLVSLMGMMAVVPIAHAALPGSMTTLLRQGKAGQARPVYQRYLRSHPRSVEARLGLAEIAMQEAHYQQARELTENALGRHPGHALVLARLGHVFRQWHRSQPQTAPENALALSDEYFRQAEAAASSQPEALAEIGHWHARQGEWEQAQTAFLKAIKLDHNHVSALQGMVDVALQRNNLSQARDYALQALDVSPQSAITYCWCPYFVCGASDR